MIVILADQASVRVSLDYLMVGSDYRILCVASGAEALARMSADERF